MINDIWPQRSLKVILCLKINFFLDIFQGRFRSLVRGVRDGKRTEAIIFGTPCQFFATPLQGSANFNRGVPTNNPQTYKQRANIWLTYCYISSSQDVSLTFLPKHIAQIHFNFHLKELLLKLAVIWVIIEGVLL